MNLFVKKKNKSDKQPVEVINSLRENIKTIEKREQHIQIQIDNCLVEAKKKIEENKNNKKNNKNNVLMILKRKKMYEVELSKIEGMKLTLESQIIALEGATLNIQTFKAMKECSNTMKQIRNGIDEDTIDDMMDDIQEEKDIHDSISEAISRPFQDMLDDQDLLNELEELQSIDDTNDMDSNNIGIRLPDVPNNKIINNVQNKVDDEEEIQELKKLEESMM